MIDDGDWTATAKRVSSLARRRDESLLEAGCAFVRLRARAALAVRLGMLTARCNICICTRFLAAGDVAS